MFGLGDRNNQQNDQIPYEVYETVQEPSYRLRLWLIRLVVALIAVTVIILAIFGIRRLLNSNKSTDKPATQSQSQQSESTGTDSSDNKGAPSGDTLPPQGVNQDPQQDDTVPGAGAPATTPQSGATNNSTVRKPE